MEVKEINPVELEKWTKEHAVWREWVKEVHLIVCPMGQILCMLDSVLDKTTDQLCAEALLEQDAPSFRLNLQKQLEHFNQLIAITEQAIEKL